MYLYDEDAWTEDIGYRFPTVAEIHEGRLIYKDFHIIAERGPQEGIYFARWVSREPTKALFGVACYGYDDEEWVGVERASIGYLTAFLVRNAREGYPVIDHKLAERIFSMG